VAHYVERFRIISIAQTYDFSLNSTKGHVDHGHVGVTTIERLGEHPGDKH
jgi:hypothetical protein